MDPWLETVKSKETLSDQEWDLLDFCLAVSELPLKEGQHIRMEDVKVSVITNEWFNLVQPLADLHRKFSNSSWFNGKRT